EFGELRDEHFAHLIDGDGPAALARDRRHAAPLNAARCDEAEVLEIRGDVQREAVRGDPTRDAHADRGDLLIPHPDPPLPFGALRNDAVMRDGADEHFFERGDVLADVAPPLAEGENRVADELAGAVIGTVA